MKTPSELSRLYRNIDRKNLSPTAQETLKKIMKANGNWRKRDEKVQQVFLDFYEKLKEKKPVLIKTTPEYKAQLLEIKRANVRKAAETRAAKFQESKEKEGAKGNQRDATRPAKRIGWRLKGKNNYKKPTIADIRAKRAYFENRVNRSDKKRKKFPMLEKGGYMAKGGFTEIGSIHYNNEEVPEKLRKGVTLKEMRDVLSQNFPYSFTFKLYELKDKTTSSPDYDKDEIKDGSIGKIKFPNYKSARGINYKISQGGENTYFDFLLEEVDTSKAVVGTFGFKDDGDVDSSYITRFIVFLMECYGLPFSIEHNVYAKGGYMAKGGFTEIGSIHYNNEEVPEKLRKGVTLKEMRDVLSQNFPYSFTFKLYELKDKTTSSPDYDKDEIKDGSIGKIKFPNYKSARGINYKISQGGENTYFDFLLEEVDTSKAVVGTFGFKDDGDVDSSYITRFIVFLMECYGLPFSIEHNVYAKGGYMADGGESNKNIYKHKYIPTMTLEVTEYTSNGVRGIQKDPKSLSAKERKQGKIVTYSSSELKELFEKINYMAKGGYMARGGQVEFLHSDSNFDNKYYKRFNGAIGSFAWIYEKRYNEGILYPLDAFDLDYYAHLPLKENEVILRYQSDRMRDVDSSMYLIKFNVKKMLVYFMQDAYSDDDKNIKFSSKGLKLEYLTIEWQGLSSKQQMNIDLDRFDKGGNVEASYSVWVRKGASDDEEVVKSNLTKSQAKKLMDSLWDKDEYYEIGMSSSTYENGGALLDYDQLIGKNILIYSMGVKNPNSYKISSVTPPDPRFSRPTLILEVGGGAEYIEGREKISNFLKGNQIEMNNGNEYYAIELVTDSKSKSSRHSDEHYAKGGQTPFEKLSNKVSDNYEGKKVPNKYQKLYGKTYDRSEAKEVGDKVAAKVYRLQQQKMARGGEILFTDKHRND